jgi:hypothetical protein
MSALATAYCEAVKKHLRVLYASFPPNEPLALGDFGVLENDLFVRLGNIGDAFGITFTSRIGTATETISFSSAGSVHIDVKAGGRLSGVVNASIEIKFANQHAVLFNAAGCTPSSVENQAALGSEIMTLLKEGRWQRKHALVTTLIAAGSTTAIASGSNEGAIVLEGRTPEIASVDLSDASIKLSVRRSRDISLEVVTEGHCSPLLGLSAVKGNVFRSDEFGPLRFLDASVRVLLSDQPEQLMFMQIA